MLQVSDLFNEGEILLIITLLIISIIGSSFREFIDLVNCGKKINKYEIFISSILSFFLSYLASNFILFYYGHRVLIAITFLLGVIGFEISRILNIRRIKLVLRIILFQDSSAVEQLINDDNKDNNNNITINNNYYGQDKNDNNTSSKNNHHTNSNIKKRH